MKLSNLECIFLQKILSPFPHKNRAQFSPQPKIKTPNHHWKLLVKSSSADISSFRLSVLCFIFCLLKQILQAKRETKINDQRSSLAQALKQNSRKSFGTKFIDEKKSLQTQWLIPKCPNHWWKIVWSSDRNFKDFVPSIIIAKFPLRQFYVFSVKFHKWKVEKSFTWCRQGSKNHFRLIYEWTGCFRNAINSYRTVQISLGNFQELYKDKKHRNNHKFSCKDLFFCSRKKTFPNSHFTQRWKKNRNSLKSSNRMSHRSWWITG